MKHLVLSPVDIPLDKILANWSTCSVFIYGPTDADCLKALLRHEVLNKNRPMIIERLTTRLLSLMKLRLRIELIEDIGELNGIRESDRKTLEKAN